MSYKDYSSEDKRFTILVHDIPNEIHRRLANATSVFGIYFCSPWLSEIDLPGFAQLLQVQAKNKPFELLTRPPAEDASWHLRALNDLRDKCNAKIYCNPGLHAKLYIVMAQVGGFAVFGSPNLTRNARSNIEIAVITYSKSFIDQLYNVFQIYLKPLCKRWGVRKC